MKRTGWKDAFQQARQLDQGWPAWSATRIVTKSSDDDGPEQAVEVAVASSVESVTYHLPRAGRIGAVPRSLANAVSHRRRPPECDHEANNCAATLLPTPNPAISSVWVSISLANSERG